MTDKYVGVQWSYDFLNTMYLNNKSKDSYREDLYYSYLHPFSQKYFSQFNPLVLIGGADFDLIQNKKTWLIRDGELILSMFFNNVNPEVLDDDIKIMIHLDCAYLVPHEWINRISYYKVNAINTYDRNNPPKKIFLTGILETLAFEKEFELAIENLSKSFTSKEFEEIEIYAYFPDKRSDLWGRWDDVNIFKNSKFMFEKLKLHIDFPEIEQIMNNNSFQDTLYYEINSGLFLKDTFLKHLVFSKGAGELRSSDCIDGYIEKARSALSLNHEIVIYDKAKTSELSTASNGNILKHFAVGFEEKQLNESWEVWFKNYLKKNFKTKKGI